MSNISPTLLISGFTKQFNCVISKHYHNLHVSKIYTTIIHFREVTCSSLLNPPPLMAFKIKTNRKNIRKSRFLISVHQQTQNFNTFHVPFHHYLPETSVIVTSFDDILISRPSMIKSISTELNDVISTSVGCGRLVFSPSNMKTTDAIVGL